MALTITDAIDKLKAEDWPTREKALLALSDMALSEEKKIAEMLSSKSAATRAAAALALGNWGTDASGSAKDLAELLTDAGEDETWLPLNVGGGAVRSPMAYRKPKCAALIALGCMKAEAYVAQMTEALDDPDWEIRFCALEALAAVGEAAKGSTGKISTLLDDDTYPVRGKACTALGSLKADDQADKLAEMLADKAQCVRTEALTALGSMGQQAAQFSGEMFALTSDDSNNVRAAAVTALGALGDMGKPYASGIASLLNDPMPDVRAATAMALGAMGPYGAAYAEDVAMLGYDEDESVKTASSKALALMGADGAAAIAN